MKEKMVQIFDEMGGVSYDQGNSLFYPVNNNLHFLNMLVLKDLPVDARILCVGVGTGADIIDLAKVNKGWRFVGIEPAGSMLKRCEDKLKTERLNDRCELVHGYLADFKSEEKFDAVLCLFVMHFVKDMEERARMYSDMSGYLKIDGRLIVTEISAEFESENYRFLLENWKSLHAHAGAPKDKLEGMSKVIEEQLAVVSPKVTEKMIESNGFAKAVCFFQSFLIKGWYAFKK